MTAWWFVAAVLLVAVGVLLLVWARLRETAARVQPVPPGLLDEGLFTPTVEPAPADEGLFVPVIEMTPAEEARYWRDYGDRDTPGCDCGHDGLGPAWHIDDCVWKTRTPEETT